MLGPFRATASLSGGLLWKRPWRLSRHQKKRARKRLRLVDNVVATLDSALSRNGMTPPNSAAAKAAQEGATAGGTEPLSSTDAAAAHEAILDADPRGGSSRLVSGVTGTATAHAPVQLPSAASTGGKTMKAIERWKAEMPTEAEMRPKDKYTMFDRKEKNYRKGIHKLPKWTRLSQRINPPGY